MQEGNLVYNRLGIPTQQYLDSRGAIPSKTDADAKIAIQEMVEYSQKWDNGTSRDQESEMEKSMFQVDANNAKDPHYPKRLPSQKEGNPLEELTIAKILVDLFKEGDIERTLGFYQMNNVNPSYQERRQSMENTLSKFMSESTKRHEENSNLIKEI
ncbi:hypothetical protein Tco_1449999 [Tanacetum coccineum]